MANKHDSNLPNPVGRMANTSLPFKKLVFTFSTFVPEFNFLYPNHSAILLLTHTCLYSTISNVEILVVEQINLIGLQYYYRVHN